VKSEGSGKQITGLTNRNRIWGVHSGWGSEYCQSPILTRKLWTYMRQV